MDLKMIVSDLDGTLFNEQSIVSAETTRALRRASQQGVTVVAATGRSVYSALDLLRPVGVIRWVLCSNGATLFDLATNSLVSNRLIPGNEVSAFLARVGDRHEEVGLAWETESELRWDQNYQDHRDALVPRPKRQEGSIARFPTGADLVKLLITHPLYSHDEWLDELGPIVGAAMTASTSGTDFVEITHATATKGQAVADLCTELGIEASQVAAFGDQMNDLDMLKWAGRGYAMQNASDAVKAVADQEAPHHADNGVAQIVDSLLGAA